MSEDRTNGDGADESYQPSLDEFVGYDWFAKKRDQIGSEENHSLIFTYDPATRSACAEEILRLVENIHEMVADPPADGNALLKLIESRYEKPADFHTVGVGLLGIYRLGLFPGFPTAYSPRPLIEYVNSICAEAIQDDTPPIVSIKYLDREMMPVIRQKERYTANSPETYPVLDEPIPHNVLVARMQRYLSNKPSIDFVDTPHYALDGIALDAAGLRWNDDQPQLTWIGIVQYSDDHDVVLKQIRRAQQLSAKTILAAPNSTALHELLQRIYEELNCSETTAEGPHCLAEDPAIEYADYYRVGRLNARTVPNVRMPIDEVATARSLTQAVSTDGPVPWTIEHL